MKKIKYPGIILAFNCLLSACGFVSQTHADITQNSSQEKTNIENLPDGNYRYCSEPPSDYNAAERGDDPDSYRWCFDFSKLENKVVGEYIYWAPWDTPMICLEGIAKKNQVHGVGYELTYGSPEPFSEEQLITPHDNSSNSKLSIWDNQERLPGGQNLKVGTRKVHSLGGDNGSYYAWLLYDFAQLNLNKLEQRKYTPFASSQDSKLQNCVPEKK